MENKAWFIWLISNLIVVFSNMQIIYTFISVNLEKELGLTIAQVALANSAYTWTFAISQFFSGAMFNVFSSKKIYFFSLSIMLFGFFVLIKSDNFAHLILSQFLIAIGASFGFIGAAHVSRLVEVIVLSPLFEFYFYDSPINPSYGLVDKERHRNRRLFGLHGVGNQNRKNMN